MNAPQTPKICNSKRRILAMQQHELLDCQSLQRSLKRMKVTSASPGELRLQRDLKHAVQTKGWQPCHHNHHSWNVPLPGTHFRMIRVSQSPEDPLQLVIELPNARGGGKAVWMAIPRLYPHRPPTIQTSDQKRIFLQAAPEDAEARLAEKNGATIVQGWTPLLRLDETIQLILPAVEQKEHVDSKIADFSMEDEDCCLRKDTLFPPNRFDLGYVHSDADAGGGGTMMQE